MRALQIRRNRTFVALKYQLDQRSDAAADLRREVKTQRAKGKAVGAICAGADACLTGSDVGETVQRNAAIFARFTRAFGNFRDFALDVGQALLGLADRCRRRCGSGRRNGPIPSALGFELIHPIGELLDGF